MKNCKCPKCGSKDVRQETDYISTAFDVLLSVGFDILKGFFRGLKTNEYMKTGLQKGNYMIYDTNHNYICNHCGYVWK